MMNELTLSLLDNPWFLFLFLAWTMPWKAVAMWRASKNNHRRWFVVLLVLNTLAIVEIIYIFFFSKPKKIELKEHEG
ncbi:MAG: DUF5652 family protein [Patescibacteria group bacterium]|nr:DUF5652 family protein [Patescibacteria group bacterium]